VKLTARQRRFTESIGYEFRNPALLTEALTHPSRRTSNSPDNQRLEFLGDRIVGLAVADKLFSADSDAREGDLASRFSRLVSGATCAEIALKIGLDTVICCDKALWGKKRQLPLSVLGDGLEALVAAVYLDSDYANARDLVNRLWDQHAGKIEVFELNPKGRLQEWAQARNMNLPQYRLVSRTGPDHAPLFVVEVSGADGQTATAHASSLRYAQQKAAAKMTARLDGIS